MLFKTIRVTLLVIDHKKETIPNLYPEFYVFIVGRCFRFSLIKKYLMKLKSIIFLLAIIGSNCNSNDTNLTCDLPPPDWFSIDLQDENENSLFNNVYPHDSIQLFNENDTVQLLWWVSPEQMQIGFESIESDLEYYIRLSSSDMDTLWVKWSTSGELCKNYHLDSLEYNHTPYSKAELIGNDIVILK